MLTSLEGRDPVEQIAEHYAARLRAGRQASIADYIARFPQYADEIRELLPTVAAMEQLGRNEASQRLADSKPRDAYWQGRRIDDYRIIREIGRGGMGVVYEAEQQALKRHVALKVLPSIQSESIKSQQRFQREAESAARLHHSNIVPVFGIGEHDGMAYYVMQLIEGVGLDEVLTELGHIHQNSTTSPQSECSPSSDAPGIPRAANVALALHQGNFMNGRKPASSADSLTLNDSSTIHESESTVFQNPDDSNTHRLETKGNPFSPGAEQDNARGRGIERRGDSYWRSVAFIGVQLSDALQYAHQHGIIHRDIKPSNLLLDQHGVIWITDFGLAKQQDPQQQVTKTGDVIGTLRYMAPEQLTGHSTARSDIYCLGCTLYEFLTFQPAFENTRIGRLVQEKNSGGPQTPRSINPRVPADLETIVLKCCASDPAERYPNAGELLLDLQRFLDDRPILARRATPAEQFLRWCRRNPAVAALSGLALILTLTVAIVSAIGYYTTNRALADVRQEYQRAEENHRLAVNSARQANQERNRAEANLDLAILAFDDIMERTAARGIPTSLGAGVEDGQDVYGQAVINQADAEILQTLLEFFDRFAAENRADLTIETATAHQHIGDIRQRLGQFKLAEDAYKQALEIHRSLSKSGKNAPICLEAQALILNELGAMAAARGSVRQAIETHTEAMTLLESADAALDLPELKAELGRTYLLLGSVAMHTGMGSVRDIVQKKSHGMPPTHRSSSSSKRIDKPLRPGVSEARKYLPKALDVFVKLSQQEPANPDYQLTLAECHRSRAYLGWMEGDSGLANQSLETAIAVFDDLVRNHPEKPKFLAELAGTLCFPELSSEETPAEYGARISRSVTICEQLVARYPHVPQYRSLLADSLTELALLNQEQDDFSAADENLQRAISYQQTLLGQFGSVSTYRLGYVESLYHSAQVKRHIGQLDDSRRLLDSAIEAAQNREGASGGGARYQLLLRSLYSSLSKTLSEMGETELAREASSKARPFRKSPAPGGGRRPWQPGHARQGPGNPMKRAS